MRAARAGVAAALCLLAACSRSDPPATRTAVLRFENLTGDPSLDWMGRAFSEQLSAAWSGTPQTWAIPLAAVRGGISAERDGALMVGANRLVYGEYSIAGGRLRVAAAVEDPGVGKIVRSVEAAGEGPADVMGAAAALAGGMGAAGRPATRNPEALRHYAEGLDADRRAEALEAFERAVAADPGCGRAWLAAIRAAGPDRAAARAVADRAKVARAYMGPVEQARLDLETANLAGDAAGRRRALEVLVRAEPADPAPYGSLATILQAEHRHPAAAALLRRAAALHPEDPGLLNSLGYAEAWAGDFKAAAAALRRYRGIRPDDANALDSLGDVHLYFGRAQDAERLYLECYAANPGFQDGGALLKAAFARLMEADLGRAGATFGSYLEARRKAHDPMADYRYAEWLWLTGQRRPGVEKLEVFAAAAEKGGAREVAARAHAHLALWSLQLGDRADARRYAERAAALAGPASAGVAGLAAFVTEAPAPPGEWALRAERRFPSPGERALKRFALASALVFGGHFKAAAPVLREAYAHWTPAGDPAIPVMLAWAWAASGRAGDAATLVERNPIPQGAGLNVFTSMWFPRLFAVRGEVLRALGKTRDAAPQYRRFLDLSGPAATVWGEERRARAALNGR